MVQPPPFAQPRSGVAFKLFLAAVSLLVLLGLLFGCFGLGYIVGADVTRQVYEDRITDINVKHLASERQYLERLKASNDKQLELVGIIEQTQSAADAEREQLQAQIDHLLKPRPSFRAIDPLYPATPGN